MVAARGAINPSIGLEWYEALHDDPKDAQARYNVDRSRAALAQAGSMPFSDGAGVDPRAAGGAR